MYTYKLRIELKNELMQEVVIEIAQEVEYRMKDLENILEERMSGVLQEVMQRAFVECLCSSCAGGDAACVTGIIPSLGKRYTTDRANAGPNAVNSFCTERPSSSIFCFQSTQAEQGMWRRRPIPCSTHICPKLPKTVWS